MCGDGARLSTCHAVAVMTADCAPTCGNRPALSVCHVAITELSVDMQVEDLKKDVLHLPGRSAGDIEVAAGGNIAGLGRGTMLQDLRDAYLEGASGATRDAHAARFDEQVLRIKDLATE